MNKMIIAALGGLAVGGAAFAGFQGLGLGQQYAEVVSADPITVKEPVFAKVLAATPITETVEGSRQVCNDRVVERRAPERFGNKDGAVVGALVGGLLGSQVGGGNGKKLATVAGAVGGGFAGREIDERHVGGRRYSETVRDCQTVSTPKTKTVGYDVQYAMDGQVGSMRMDKKPGEEVQLGERDKTIGYDVTWKYEEQTGTLKMTDKPGPKLPIRDGVIQVATNSIDAPRG